MGCSNFIPPPIYCAGKIAVVALEYLEPDYKYTMVSLETLDGMGVPIYKADRKGVGNMAKAYNQCFLLTLNEVFHWGKNDHYDYIWFVSNIIFNNADLAALVDAMDETGYAAICPVYASDHAHLQPKPGRADVQEVPYVEFTCPIVRSDVFQEFPLDEKLPYYYHDLDWSYRVKQAGYKLGVHNGVQIEHVYLRNNKSSHPVTRRRAHLRRLATPASQRHMLEKYGPGWEKLMQWKK